MRARAFYLPAVAGLAVALAFLTRSRKHNRDRAQQYLQNARDTDLRDVRVRMPVGSAVLGLAALVGGYLLTREARRRPGERHSVEESIELEVPVTTAYNQWTQFEEFPKFMASVESVQQLDDTHLHWRANIGGKLKEWDAEITEQIPDERISWRSTGGVKNAGVVTFDKIDDAHTRVRLHMDYDPETLAERVGDVAGAVKLTTKGNLRRFKEMLESRGRETGAWRGTVTQH